MIFFEKFRKEVVHCAAAFEAGLALEFFGGDADEEVAAVAFFVFEGDLVAWVAEMGAQSSDNLVDECHG